MLKRFSSLIVFLMIASVTMAQQEDQYYQLDPKPFDSAVDVETDLFVSGWKGSAPRFIHGSMMIQDIFSPLEGAILKPSKRGAVLTQLEAVSHATVPSHTSTTSEALKGRQEIFYCFNGEGIIISGGKSQPVRGGFAVLVPPDITFSIQNATSEPLEFYMWTEPVPKGFTPRNDILIRNLETVPFSNTPSHWTNYTRPIFTTADGLALLTGFSEVLIYPMTIAQMHASRPVGTDVVWVAVEGDIYTQLGKKLYHMEPGMGFKNPSDGRVYHGNINTSDKPIKLIWSRTVSMPEEYLEKWPLK